MHILNTDQYNSLQKQPKYWLALMLCWTCSGVGVAKDLDLKYKYHVEPPYPNVMVTLDDSNSMRYDISYLNEYPIAAYVTNSNSFVNHNDPYHNYWRGVLRDLAPNTPAKNYITAAFGGFAEHEHIELPHDVRHIDWRTRSFSFNKLYYNPHREYKPISDFPNADFHAVRLWPLENSSRPERYHTVVDLAAEEFGFVIAKDTAGFDSAKPRQNKINRTPNGIVDLWDDHTVYTFHADGVRIEEFKLEPVPLASVCNPIGSPNPHGSFVTCFNGTMSTVAWNNQFGRTLEQEKQNIANWFQYHRTRGLALTSAVAFVIDSFPKFRFSATSFIGHAGSTLLAPPLDEFDETIHNRNLIRAMLYADNGLKGSWQGTFTARGLQRANNLLVDNSTGQSPMIHSCQQNFNLLVSDGLRSPADNVNGFGDQDGDGTQNTLADVAAYYYKTDLRPDLLNNVVPRTSLCPSVPLVDHQHIRTFAVGFGLPPTVEKDAKGCWPKLQPNGSLRWYEPNPLNYVEKPEEMWLAAYNSGGAFTDVVEPELLQENISEVFNVLLEAELSLSGIAVSSGIARDGTLVFQAMTNESRGIGDVSAFMFSDGKLNKIPTWSAKSHIDNEVFADTERLVLVYDHAAKKTKKLNGNLPIAQMFNPAQLNRVYNGIPIPDRDPAQLLNWVNATAKSQLGGIVFTEPAYVGPSLRTPQLISTADMEAYLSYRKRTNTRPGMVYVGTSDGFIHGFEAATGKEVFKLRPNSFVDEHTLAGTGLTPEYKNLKISGKFSVNDVFFENENKWRTILLAPFGTGQTGLIALDVTDPSNFKNDFESLVLWEHGLEHNNGNQFNGKTGHIMQAPAIVQLMDGKYYAVMGNGYNSARKEATLLFIDVTTGTMARSLDTAPAFNVDPAGEGRSNGFSEPALVDLNQDGIIDHAYVGDFFGNLYAFDLSSPNKFNWKSVYGGVNGTPFFATESGAPITTKPAVVLDSNKVPMVIFGTGDIVTNTSSYEHNWPYALYGVRDKGSKVIVGVKTNDIEVENKEGGVVVKYTPNEDALHWRLEMKGPLASLRLHQNPEVRFNEARFVLQKPTTKTTSCGLGGVSTFYLVLDPFTGAGPTKAVFKVDDNNNPGEGKHLAGIGLKSTTQSVLMMATEGAELLINNDTSTEINILERHQLRGVTGRRAWWPLVD